MYQNYDVLARGESYLGMMKQACRIAFLTVQGPGAENGRAVLVATDAATQLLLDRIDEFEKKGFEKWKALYSRPKSYIMKPPERFRACFEAIASGSLEEAASILTAPVDDSDTETESRDTHSLSVSEILYDAGEVLRDCILEVNPEMDEQKAQGMIFGYMRSTVQVLSGMPGDGAIQSYAPVLALGPEEAVAEFRQILVQAEGQKVDEENVREAIREEIERMRSLLVCSVNRWADVMKVYYSGDKSKQVSL